MTENIKEESTQDDSKESEVKIKQYKYVPSNIISFADYDAYESAEDVSDAIHTLMSVHIQIVENVLYGNASYNPLADIQNATVELLRRLSLVNYKSLDKDYSYKNKNISLIKSANGNLEWLGIPTNNYIDRENDIFTANAHRDFVKTLREGEAQYPWLYIWHIEEPVGVTTAVDYDERGFLKAKGIVFPQYEELVKTLVAAEPNMGMSHGNKLKVLKFNETNKNWIEKYQSHEFTFLPVDNAANALTGFKLGE